MSPLTFAQTRSRGFTLVELLVVIAIIAVLSILAFVGRAQMVRSANRSVCATNMRTVGQAVLLWANDNRGRLPPLNDLRDAEGNFIPSTSWSNVVIPYLQGKVSEASKLETTRQVMRCPEQRKVILVGAGISNEAAITSIHQLRNFALNFYLGPSTLQPDNWRTLASIRNPSRTMMLTESGIQTTFTCVSVIDTGFISQSTRGADGVLRKGVHGDFNNIVWADGHVSSWEDISRMVRAPYRPDSTDDLWKGL